VKGTLPVYLAALSNVSPSDTKYVSYYFIKIISERTAIPRFRRIPASDPSIAFFINHQVNNGLRFVSCRMKKV